jgi:methylglyoxal synthase
MKVKVSNSPIPSEFEELDLTLATRKGEEYLIGRSPDSDLVLDSPDVSRLHAKFFCQGGNYYFSDLGSRNGSTINGKLAEKNQLYILKDKDIIRIGDFILMMEEMISLDQGAETIVRIINPSVFSNRRTTQNVSSSNIGEETPEIVTPVAEEISQSEDKVEVSEAVYAEPITTPENVIQSLEIVSEVPSAIVGESEFITDTPVTAEETTNEATSNTSDDSEYYTTVQPRNISQESQAESNDSEYYTTVQPRNISQESQAESDDSEITVVQSRDIASEPQAITQTDDISEAIAQTSDITEPQAIAQTDDISEAITQTSDITEPQAIAQTDDISEAIAQTTNLDQSHSEVPQIIAQKHIVLIAHETKKSELAEFVVQHKEFLSQCLTITWSSVSEVLHQQAGITVTEQIPPAISGGYQRINSLVNSGDILAVIFIRDFLAPQPGQANEEALLRICNINQVLLANNIPTAEAIMHYIQHTAR